MKSVFLKVNVFLLKCSVNDGVIIKNNGVYLFNRTTTPASRYKEAYNLYVCDNSDIKVGDPYLYLDSSDSTWILMHCQTDVEAYNCNNPIRKFYRKKIIASTDSRVNEHHLPLISLPSIVDVLQKFNEGKLITHVAIEYTSRRDELISKTLEELSSGDNLGDVFCNKCKGKGVVVDNKNTAINYCSSCYPESLVISKSNEINLLLLKDSWTKPELISELQEFSTKNSKTQSEKYLIEKLIRHINNNY